MDDALSAALFFTVPICAMFLLVGVMSCQDHQIKLAKIKHSVCECER